MLKIDSKSIIKAAALVSALGVLGTAAWAVGEVTELRPALIKELRQEFRTAMDQTELNTLAIAKQEFNWLEERKKRGGELTYEEKRDFCKNAQILQYPVEGCDKASGEPIFIIKSPTK